MATDCTDCIDNNAKCFCKTPETDDLLLEIPTARLQREIARRKILEKEALAQKQAKNIKLRDELLFKLMEISIHHPACPALNAYSHERFPAQCGLCWIIMKAQFLTVKDAE